MCGELYNAMLKLLTVFVCWRCIVCTVDDKLLVYVLLDVYDVNGWEWKVELYDVLTLRMDPRTPYKWCEYCMNEEYARFDRNM